MQGLADKIASLGRNVVIILAEDLEISAMNLTEGKKTYHQHLAFDISSSLQAIIVFAQSKGLAVDICGKITHACLDPAIQRTAIG